MPVTMRRVQTLLRTTLCSKNALFLLQVMTVVPSSHASKSSSFLIQLHADMWREYDVPLIEVRERNLTLIQSSVGKRRELGQLYRGVHFVCPFAGLQHHSPSLQRS
ncbi:hypothetical protein F5J12DRAFT_305189 [Pisolithus orientalis]|uniref:uncharacterized protein n=1 Tax=Pisolithus orientalis TaxID=936130 RepID=UPI002225B2C8|nr:uncharacterized protein F5J12DRAFT_305189 [Pisolithus orientalis]KAI6030708.1 hypothetical protein F5J12DRAFT_305189 [Pisolithus orientalis]